MNLSPVISRYFDAWIINHTWDSGHLCDRERFYRFVKAVKRHYRPPAPAASRHPVSSPERPSWRWPLPGEIRALILQRWRGRRTNAALNNAAERYAALYHTLLEYEKTRGFPDPLIARTNIVSYYWRLGPRNHTDKDIDRKMINAWGKDWKSKLQAKITPVVIAPGVLSNVRPKRGVF